MKKEAHKKTSINYKRIAVTVLLAPFITSVICTSGLTIWEILENGMPTINSGLFSDLSLIILVIGWFIYPAMFLVGLPTLIIFNKKNIKKLIIFVLFGIFCGGITALIIGLDNGGFILLGAVFGGIHGLVTWLFMHLNFKS